MKRETAHVGFFDRLLSAIGDSYGSLDNCPYCGESLVGFGCTSCDVEFVFEDGKMVEAGLSRQGGRSDRRCTNCDTPMRHGGEFTAAWEDGDNEDAYIRCPSCGYENNF